MATKKTTLNTSQMTKAELMEMVTTLINQNVALNEKYEAVKDGRKVTEDSIIISEPKKGTFTVEFSGKSMKTLVAFAKQLKDDKGTYLLSYDSDAKVWKTSLKGAKKILEDFKNEMLEMQPR